MGMNEMKHEPGPWRYDLNNYNVYGRGQIASVYGHIHNGERVANLKLMAAAPELLASLKSLFELMDKGVIVRNIDDDYKSDFTVRMLEFTSVLKKAHDAVKKAED